MSSSASASIFAALRLAYLLVGERAAAEDVMQDSFLLAHQGIVSLPPGSTDGAGVIPAMTRCPLGPAQKGRGDV